VSNVIVTGASSGLGAALAREFAADGHTVGLVARREDRLASVTEDCQASAPDSAYCVSDLGERGEPERVAAWAQETFGGIDVLVNNAALPGVVHVSRLDPDEVERVMNVNFHAAMRLTLALLPSMIGRGSGYIVNVSSLGGKLGIPGEAAYCASKFALGGWSEALALDLTGTGVRVKLVLPGAVDTEIWDKGAEQSAYDGPKTPAAEVAQEMVAGLSDDSFEMYVPAADNLHSVVRFKTAKIDEYFAATLAAFRK
jgi:short-subunit dehydrogenase